MDRNFAIQFTLEWQAMVIKEHVTGKLILPSKEDMLIDLDNELKMNEEQGYFKAEFYSSWFKAYSFKNLYKDLCTLRAKQEIKTIY